MRDLGDGGGRRDDEAATLFPYAEEERLSGSPTDILQAVDDIQTPTDQLVALRSELDAQHRTVAENTSGVVDVRTLEAPRVAKTHLRRLLATSLCAAGSTRVFAVDGVQAYNKFVDKLRSEYTTRKIAIMTSDCGVPKATYPENTTAEDKKKIDDTRQTQIDNLRDEKVTALVSELRVLQEKYKKDPLDAQAATAARRLREGPTDQLLIDLFKAGALPLATVAAFPHIEFRYEKIPPDLTHLTPDELEEFVRNHPEVRPLIEALLRRGQHLNGQELELVKAQARVDARSLREAVESGDRSQTTLDRITQSQHFLRLINSLTASDKRLSAAAHAYSFAWLDGVGADALSKLSKFVAESVPHAREIPNYLSPVGDAILNLSNEKLQATVLPENQGTVYAFDLNGDGRIDKEDMPESVQELMELRIGVYHDGNRSGTLNESGEYNNIDGVDNLDAVNGWARLISASTVDGGREFSVDLAEQAIQIKQDLNAILADARGHEATFLWTDEEWNAFKAKINDTGASQLLSVVARNENAASDLLLDEARRQQILGMNWTDGQGAADVIRAGTDRNPEDGGGTSLQAKAAMRVMLEIASDPTEYMKRATNEAVSDAIVDGGITWIDTFGENIARDRMTQSTVWENTTDVLGRPLPFSVTLSEADQLAFLQFIASTGDDDAVRFEAASQFYGRQLIADALEQGDQDKVSDALSWAARADGLIRRANIDWAVDVLGDKNDIAKAKLLAYNRMMAASNVVAKVTVEVLSTGASLAFEPGALFIAGGKGIADSIISEVLGPKPIPDFKEMEEDLAIELLEDDAKDADARRNYLLAQVAIANGLSNDPKYAPLFNEDGSLKDLDEINNVRHGRNLLQSLAERPLEKWNAEHPDKEQSVRITDFDGVRHGANTGHPTDKDPRNNNSWRNDRIAERNLYGDNVPDYYKSNDRFEDGTQERYPDENYQLK